MAWFQRLFGSKPVDVPTQVYEGYRIIDAPMREGAKFRMSARIELDMDGETKVHHLIRADTFDDCESAASAALVKAKQVIDQQGKSIFR